MDVTTGRRHRGRSPNSRSTKASCHVATAGEDTHGWWRLQARGWACREASATSDPAAWLGWSARVQQVRCAACPLPARPRSSTRGTAPRRRTVLRPYPRSTWGSMRSFLAPWGSGLKLSTSIACAVVGVPAIVQLSYSRPIGWLLLMVLVLPVLGMVRGYRLTPTHLEVQRAGWTTRLPLAGLTSAAIEPGVMARSLRAWGNGGAFAITGRFRNTRLGAYRAYVTDTSRTVVLRFRSETVVISPDDPQRFTQV